MYELSLIGERETAVGHTQKWRVHLPGLTNRIHGEILEVDLFKVHGKWHAWTGNFIRQVDFKMANSVAKTVNWLEGNPI
jgi:hypothetical protein